MVKREIKKTEDSKLENLNRLQGIIWISWKFYSRIIPTVEWKSIINFKLAFKRINKIMDISWGIRKEKPF